MEGPLTVVSVATARTWRGGEGQVLALNVGLRDRGHRAIIAARPDAVLMARARDAGVETEELRIGAALSPWTVGRLRKILRRVQPDIVHMHDAHAQRTGVLASRLAGVGRRVVSRRVPFAKRGLRGRKYRRGVDRYIAISGNVRGVLLESGVDAARIAVVPDGVDPLRFAAGDAERARDEARLPAGCPLVGTAAHFAASKSLDTLIRAAPAIVEAVPEARVVLLGDGEHRDALEALRRESPVADRILMPGFFENVPDFLAAFDVFVMPSRVEGLCSSLLEAQAAGTPVAGARVPGVSEVIDHEATGLLFDPGGHEPLAAAVVRLLRDSDEASAFAAAAKERLRERFTHDAMVEGTLAVYRDVLAAR